MTDIFTESEMHELWTDILERMLRAGWVHRFAHSVKRGWHVEWTPLGLQRIALLGDLVDALKLCDDDRGALAFDTMARGGSLRSVTFVGPRDATVDAFWRQSVDALGISGDVDRLLVFAHVAKTYSPSSEKDVIVLPSED